MARHDLGREVGCHARSTNNEWNVDVFFVTARFAWLQTMLTDVEAIVAAVEDISIVKQTLCFQTCKDAIDKFIHRL